MLTVIWSLIIYKFFVVRKDSSNVTLNTGSYSNELITTKRDSFQLSILKRDPFLDTYKNVKRSTPKKKRDQQVKKKKRTLWPEIQYLGYVQGEKYKKPLVILSIDSKIVRIRKGDKNYGLFVKNISEDTIYVLRNKEKRFFVKK
ncbi:hypothetical protein ACFFGL_11055 [Mesonia maritima]